jgi:hypothetical protein
MTPHAFVLVPLGLLLTVFSRKWLYRVVVASTLFSGTAVFNFGSGDGASGVQVWMFFGSLWLVREGIVRLVQGRLSIRRNLLTPIVWLSMFLFTAALSLVMPIYINGHLQIGAAFLTDNSATPLVFTSRNVTAWLYLAFGGLLAIAIAEENGSVEKLRATGQIYLWSGVFVALWGFVQIGCSLIGVPYPAFLFNNSVSPGATGYLATLPGLEIFKMSSVAVESSVLSQSLLTVLALTVPALLGAGSVVSIKVDRYCALLIVAALIAAASASAYAGLLFLAVASVVLAVRMKIKRSGVIIRRGIVAAAVATGLVFILYTQVPVLGAILDLILFAKASSYSGLERLKTIELASGYFSRYPLLGVGWGSVTSHDLLFKLLANVGLVGTASFFAMLIWMVVRIYRDIRTRHDPLAMTQMIWLLGVSVFILTNALGGFAYVVGYMWFVFGMAFSCASLTASARIVSGAVLVPGRPELKPHGSIV